MTGVQTCALPISLFLKIPYHGPAPMEALAGYDRSLVVGILGGSAGTTFDAFQMLWEAKKYGARVALYGRKINNAEDQLTFVKYLRLVADDQIEPQEAVRAYHADLNRLGIRPYRSLSDDLARTDGATGYAGTSGPPGVSRRAPSTAPDEPDFSKMTAAEKARWNLDRWKRIIG